MIAYYKEFWGETRWIEEIPRENIPDGPNNFICEKHWPGGYEIRPKILVKWFGLFCKKCDFKIIGIKEDFFKFGTFYLRIACILTLKNVALECF